MAPIISLQPQRAFRTSDPSLLFLKNEKYVGDVLLQKTYVKDLLSGKQIKNTGEKERYLYQHHHPAIVSRELFEKVNPEGILEE